MSVGVDATIETPFVGLVPYGEDDAAFFFGRDRETRIVAGNLRATPLTLLYGASGVGKTSLLRAGVLRHLHEELRQARAVSPERVPFAVCVFSAWRDQPLPALMESVRASAAEALGDDAQLLAASGDVVETLRSWTDRIGTLLVILDQFEDYVTYQPDDDGPGTLAGELPAIVNDPDLHVHVLLSIREDALAKLDRFKGIIPRLFSNYVRVPHLGRAAAERAIEGPVQEWNRRFPGSAPYVLGPGLVDAVVEAATVGNLALVRAGTDVVTSNGGERVEAPYLQLVMQRLWRETAAARSHDLTVATLDALGGPQRIVESHLLESLGALTEDEQAVAADLFRFLVTRSKTKIAHPVSDLVEWTGRTAEEVSSVLETLCRAEGGRIMRRVPPPPPSGGEERFELFHDVLAEPILEWRRDHEQEARRRAAVRRFLRIGGALVALSAIFAALGVWALAQRSEAQDATRSASSLALASSARVQLDGHVERSLLLGLEALREETTPEARSAMVEALQVARGSGAAAILRGGSVGVRTIAYSPDGSTLASADFDGALRLWDMQARKPLGEPLVGHTGEVWGLAFSPDGATLASASFDGTVRLWNVADGSPRGDPIDVGVGAVRSVAFGSDGGTLAFGGSDGTVRLWDIEEERPAGVPLRGHRGSVWAVDLSPDGRTLASGGTDRTVRLWDLQRDSRRVRVLEGQSGTIASLDFSPDGRLLASSDLAGEVRLWDARTLEPRGAPLRAGSGQVWSVSFSPDGRRLAAAGFDGTIRTWDVRSGEEDAQPLRGHARAVIAVAYASDGTLASASYDGTVRLWPGGTASPLGDIVGTHDDRVTTVAVGPDGRILASGGFDRVVRLWELELRRARGRLEHDDLDSVESVAVSPDGSILAAADVGGSIWLWEMPAGTEAGRLTGHDDAVTGLAFGRDGTMLASASTDGTVRLWDLATRRQIGDPLTGHESEVLDVAFSSDGRTLATSGADGTLRLWDAVDQAALAELPLPEGEIVVSLAFAPDGDTLASGTVGGYVRLWDVPRRGQLGEQLAAHVPRNVEDVAFGPDGETLVSAGSDATVRLWDVSGRIPLGRPLRGHTGAVFGVAFTPDGRAFASGGDDTTVRLWEGILWRDLADLERQVCDLVVRDFTRSEWDELVPGLAYRTTCPE